jgi:hypothetical protein
MDENIAPAEPLNPVVVEDNSPAPSASEEPNTSVESESQGDTGQSTQNESTEEPNLDATQEAERQQQRPAARKIQKLLEENKQLKELIGQPSVPEFSQQQSQKMSEYFQGKDSILPEELDQYADQYAAQKANGLVDLKVQQLEQKIVQQEAYKNLELDTQKLESEPLFKDFPELEETISNAWKQLAVKETLNPYNPNLPPVRTLDPRIRLSDVAKSYLEAVKTAAERGSAKQAESVAALADTASVSLTPETSTKTDENSIDSLRDKLADFKF